MVRSSRMCVRVRPLVVTALLLLLACGGVARGEDPGRPRPERHVLGNGVVLIVQERLVVLDEVRLTEDDPDRFLARRLSEEAYRPTSYGRPILGTPEQIRALTREQLARYYHKHYVPKNMSLVVVGAVDPGLIRRAADDAFGRLRGPDSPRAPMPPPPDLGGRSGDLPRPEKQAHPALALQAAAVAG